MNFKTKDNNNSGNLNYYMYVDLKKNITNPYHRIYNYDL